MYDSETRRLIEVVEHPEHGPIVREAAARVFAGETFYAIAKDWPAKHLLGGSAVCVAGKRIGK